VFLSLGHVNYEDVTDGRMPAPRGIARLAELIAASGQERSSETRTATARASSLPRRDYQRFVGREAELQTVMATMHPDDRKFVVVIDGIGGAGKTTLALEAAHRLIEVGPSGGGFDVAVWMSAKVNRLATTGVQNTQSELAALHDLQRAIGSALGRDDLMQLPEAKRSSVVRDLLRGPSRALLVLDNLETVDDELILAFLRDLPQPAKAIVTSRHRIDVALAIRLEGLPESEAAELIRTEAEARGIELSDNNVADLHRKTGGLPLAIVWSLGLLHMGHSVESVLRRLGAGHSDITAFCFRESVGALDGTDALRLLGAASMFDEPVERELLGEAAGLGGDVVGRDDSIARLIQLSLINLREGRFSLLPLTRTYVTQLMAERSELQVDRAWLAALLEIARDYGSPDPRWRSITRLQQFGPHLESAYHWARAKGSLTPALALARAVCAYLECVGRWDDLLSVCEELETLATADTDLLLDLAWYQNWIHGQRGEFAQAWAALERVRSLAVTPEARVQFLLGCSQTRRRQRRFDESDAFLAEIDPLLPPTTDRNSAVIRANISFERGKLARDRGDWDAAERWLRETAQVFDADAAADALASGKTPNYDIERALGVLGNLGLVEHRRGNLAPAAALLERSLRFTRDHGSVSNLGTLLIRFADVLFDLGRTDEAVVALQEARPIIERLKMYDELDQFAGLSERWLVAGEHS
jgi:tetratricopeptide (TPR) repeat protein